MSTFGIEFTDPVPAVVSGIKIKPAWEPGSWGGVSIEKNGLSLRGSPRLSSSENFLSSGIMGQIVVKSFFQAMRFREQRFNIGEISVVIITSLTTTPCSQGIVHVLVGESDKTRDIVCFTFTSLLAHMRAEFWLLLQNLTAVLPESKLQLRSDVLAKELHMESAPVNWGDPEMCGRIAEAFFNSCKSLTFVQPVPQPFDELGGLYGEVFGGGGREIALRMLVAKDKGIRATALACLSKLGNPEDVAVLEPFLEDELPQIRAVAAHALLKFPSERTRHALEKTSHDKDRGVRQAAKEALNKLGQTI